MRAIGSRAIDEKPALVRSALNPLELCSDGIGAGRVLSCLTDVLIEALAGEDFVQPLGGDLHVLTEVNRQFVSELLTTKLTRCFSSSSLSTSFGYTLYPNRRLL